jgi:hypothetical protein
LLSVLLAFIAYVLVDLLFDDVGQPAYQMYVVRSLVPHAEWGQFSDAEIMTSLGWLAGAIVIVSVLGGLVFGKLFVWGMVPLRSLSSPVVDMSTGILPPSVFVSVLSKTIVGDAVLVYKGLLANVQVGPEGQVEYVLLTEATKSLLFNAANVVPAHVGRINRPKENRPHTSKPFEPINANTAALPGPTSEFLLVEKNEIANLYFERIDGLVPPSGIDSVAYRIGNRLGWIG